MGMVKGLKRRFALIATVIILSAPAGRVRGDIIINEVLANEPESYTSLEWIELYNNSDSTKLLSRYAIRIASVDYPFPGIAMEPNSYLVVCKQAFATGSTPGFESYWGNYDGIWGDDPSEDFAIFVQPGFSLKNDSGMVYLKHDSTVISVFQWIGSGADGVSWERYLPSSSVIVNAVVPPGMTPGKINSIAPGDRDLALISLEAAPYSDSLTDIIFRVANIGINNVGAGEVGIYYDNDRDSIVAETDLIVSVALPAMKPGDTLTIESGLKIDGYYANILVILQDDDKLSNNIRSLVVPGEMFPPLIISEFMPDPELPLETEWIEIKNRSDSAININGWLLGDGIRLYQMTTSDKIIDTGQYLVLCEDSLAFRNFYADISIPLLQMPGWAILNNDSDEVRLADNLGYPADSFVYSMTYGENHSWGRGERAGESDRWGRSVAAGGTPGDTNEIYFQPISNETKITVEPDPFSLSRDRETTISFTVPAAENLSLRVYDLEGRIVKTILDNFPTLDGQISWDGRSDGGRLLRPGIYILYLEVFGKGEYKKTVVVAP
jgi:hypothetical protein